MELTIAMAISILSAVLTVANFVLNRKDKAIKDVKENHQELIEYQLRELKEDVKAILTKLDKFDKDIDDRISNAIDMHVKLYHKGETK
jgi:peptidoglycan hydrolase CwlO-like protein